MTSAVPLERFYADFAAFTFVSHCWERCLACIRWRWRSVWILRADVSPEHQPQHCIPKSELGGPIIRLLRRSLVGLVFWNQESRIPGRHRHLAPMGCRIRAARGHAKIPVGGITFERLVFEVEQEVPRICCAWLCWQRPRFCRQPVQSKIPFELVKLSPIRCPPTEPTLAAPPSFVVGRAQSIAPAFGKPQLTSITGLEAWESPRVQVKRQHQCGAFHADLRHRCAGLGVPAVVQLGEFRA